MAGDTTLGIGPFVDARAAVTGVTPTEFGPPPGGSVRTLLGKAGMTRPQVVLRAVEGSGQSSFDSPSMSETTGFGDSLGRYHLDGEIARGGMGIVLKGFDSDLGRDLAIKVLLEQHRDKPDLVRRFVEEARIGGQLQHPGVVPVYELGMFPDARPYFSMKLVQGRTLETLLNLRSDPGADRERFLAIFEQVCQTMAYAHARGVVHRDLKPSNVMVGTFGEVQVRGPGDGLGACKGAGSGESGLRRF
jgi:hypothetical protein